MNTKDLITCDDGVTRCAFQIEDLDFRRYHDEEFGRPVASDRRIFEKICIEGFGSGLSFLTVLKKREALRDAFDNFEIDTVANYNRLSVDRLMRNDQIIQNRRKIESVLNNARRARELQDKCGSLAAFVWQFEPSEDNRPEKIDLATVKSMPETPASTKLAKSLKDRGWSWVGPTSIQAVMQSIGIVNDHFHGCDIRQQCEQDRLAFERPLL